MREALAKIDQVHPDLAAHLRGTLQMGTRCSYSPAEPRHVEGELTALRTSASQRPSPKDALMLCPGLERVRTGQAANGRPSPPGSSASPRNGELLRQPHHPWAGCPLAAAPTPRSTTEPSTDSSTVSTARSDTGIGGPTATQAADEPSAVLSSSVNR